MISRPEPAPALNAELRAGATARRSSRRARRRAGLRALPWAGNIAARPGEALARGGSAAGGGWDSEIRSAGTGAAWSRASTMSSICDVVVVGGGISGQSRLRALPPPALGQVVARGRRAGRGLSPGAPRLAVLWAGTQRAPNAAPGTLTRGKDFSAPLDRSRGLEIC